MNENYCENGKIYKVTNTENNKVYIGTTTRSLAKRLGELKRECLKNQTKSEFQLDMIKIGTNNFHIELLQDGVQDITELSDLEVYFINYYNSFENGYNRTKGGEIQAMRRTTREKIAETMKGVEHSEKTREKLSQSMLGVPKTEEHKFNMLKENRKC